MIATAFLLLALAGPLDEAEGALQSGRLIQSGAMIDRMITAGVKGPRFDRLRAGQALASGRYEEALRLYGTLAWRDRSSVTDREGAGMAAYRLKRREDARGWADQAMALPKATWRAFNLCGVLADDRNDFAAAERCYDEADRRAPARAEVANNRGWSLLLQGRWDEARLAFEHALSIDPADRIARSNLDLALAAQANDLPARKPGEDDADYGRRLNDAGVMAAAAGRADQALAAFANSVEVRAVWSPVAARNLEDASRR